MNLAPSDRWINGGLIALVAIMPFHAFLSVSLGHFIGAQFLWQSWKEILLLALIFLAGYRILKDPATLQRLRDPVVYLLVAFCIIALAITAVTRPELRVAIFGIKTDLEFIAAFLLAMAFAGVGLRDRLSRILIIATAVVIAFGLIQIYLLPPDWLTNFGYGSDTIPPFLLVDPVLESFRILSTLGGPNQLGSFMILPLALVLWKALNRPQWWQPIYLIAGMIVLWHTYSRSAILGFCVAVGVILLLRLKSSWRLPTLLVLTLAAALAVILIPIAAGKYPQLQYYVFHQRLTETGFQGSTDQHDIALKEGVDDVESHPWGRGLGTAGPASFRGSNANIPESTYLQLAIETGLIGLALFIAAQIALGVKLWVLSPRVEQAAPLAAALAGIAVINFFLHGWADSSTALVYWTLAGAVLGSRT